MATVSEAAQQANRSGMDPRRLMVIFTIVIGLVFALFLDNVLSPLFARLNVRDREVIAGLEGWDLSRITGVLITGALLVGAWAHAKTRQLGFEVASELMKVTWPSWHETRVATVAVVIASMIAAVLLFGIDSLSYSVMVDWLPALWKKVQP